MKPKIWVLIPTYNNERSLKEVIQDVLKYTSNIIIVNDGSTDSTSDILSEFNDLPIISYSQNQGKGNALQLGFKKAIELGADYAITIDSDGQHFASNLPDIIECIYENPNCLVMGSRNMQQEGIPKKSSFGNSFSNFWFWAETGISLSDTQTGFRAYPLAPIASMHFFTKRFEFEIEIIVRLAWQNVKFKEVPIRVAYPEDRVSHFRPTKDFTRISILNTILFTLALVFFLPRLLILNFNLQDSLKSFKKEISSNLDKPLKISAAIGIGLFFGIFPIWGFQMIVAFAVATYFKLNRALVLLSSNISIPPFLPIIIYGSYKIGAFFVSNPELPNSVSEIEPEMVYAHLLQYTLGSCSLAIIMGLLGFSTSWLIITGIKLFRLIQK